MAWLTTSNDEWSALSWMRQSRIATDAQAVFDLESDQLNRRRGAQKMRSHQVALLVSMTCAAIPASAQSLCELVPAAVVQSTLGISVTLTAASNTQGGNGCAYKGASTGPLTLTADTISDAGIYKTIFDQRLHSLGPTQQLVSGVGDAAYYDFKQRQQIPKYPGVNITQPSHPRYQRPLAPLKQIMQCRMLTTQMRERWSPSPVKLPMRHRSMQMQSSCLP